MQKQIECCLLFVLLRVRLSQRRRAPTDNEVNAVKMPVKKRSTPPPPAAPNMKSVGLSDG